MAHIHSLVSLCLIIYIIVCFEVCGFCFACEDARPKAQMIKSSKTLNQYRAGHLTTIWCLTLNGDLADLCEFICNKIPVYCERHMIHIHAALQGILGVYVNLPHYVIV
ncbi:unnamed protein product [Fusarium venenatum]|uniref:Uncharacterized protein n=1 Tax=Fusarium venenatum TaxID=56646 RepID=A0A2L2SN20_9HYPO|nr:LOW QUALITY PROTEIN: uncharacterized protein FVRRES_11475 [Fusarium venenatum]CEI38784.1 unnamed protein product [Fusarium venenatum]